MKKRFIGILAIVMLLCVGCGTKEDSQPQQAQEKHMWVAATCTSPSICSDCGDTKGEPLGHDWIPATCTEPKKCSRCLITDGEALGHDWEEATCTSPKTCSICGKNEGKLAEHSWIAATCIDPQRCSVCGTEEGAPKGHQLLPATCTTPETCSACGEIKGLPLGHEIELSCTESSICSRCGEKIPPAGHDWEEETCTTPKNCKRCGVKEGEALGHDPGEEKTIIIKKATCTEGGQTKKVTACKRCSLVLNEETIDESPLGHTTANGICSRCGEFIVEPIVFTGSGDKVISNLNIPNGVYKVVLENTGTRNFIVVAYKSNGDRLSSLANKIGDYKGSVILTENINGGVLEIKSKGKWKISFEQIPQGGTSNISGSGDWVSPWFTRESGALVVSMTYKGDHNFIVVVYDENGKRYSSLANEIGDYNGSKVFNKGVAGMHYCIEVTSSGKWTVDFGLGDKITKQ